MQVITRTRFKICMFKTVFIAKLLWWKTNSWHSTMWHLDKMYIKPNPKMSYETRGRLGVCILLIHLCVEWWVYLEHSLLTSSSIRLLVVQCPCMQASGVRWLRPFVSCRLVQGSCRPPSKNEPQHNFAQVVCLLWQLCVDKAEGSWGFSEPGKQLGSAPRLMPDGHTSAWEPCWQGKNI